MPAVTKSAASIVDSIATSTPASFSTRLLVSFPTGILAADTTSDETTEEVLDGLTILIGVGAGVLCGLVLALVITGVAKVIARKEIFTRMLFKRISRPLLVTCMLSGGYLGISYTLSGLDIDSNEWIGRGEHLLLILVIAGITWLLSNAVYLIEDIARRDSPEDTKIKDRHSRIYTQAQIIRRVLQAIIVVLGIATIILTFPAARMAMSSVLASAGVASIVATLAAQSMLANMLAGLQLALSDAIRVNDVIQVPGIDGVKEGGTIEEITLTYVVIKLFDDRRMVVPSSQFTQSAFENWSRRAHQMQGTVELYLDYAAPIEAIRARVDYLLSLTDLWDGRAASVTVTEMTEQRITVRILVSAKNSGDIWTLRCYLREELIGWITREMPQILPTQRVLPLQIQRLSPLCPAPDRTANSLVEDS